MSENVNFVKISFEEKKELVKQIALCYVLTKVECCGSFLFWMKDFEEKVKIEKS